ncbi:MAG: fluoride efflux transporter FluC [Jatrophihabitantaceae bacterium]
MPASGSPFGALAGSPLVAIAVGGILGAEARYVLTLALPHSRGQFPWSTLLINLTGSLLIGVLMVVLYQLRAPHRLLRPFLGIGLLGGYTTYSAFAVDVQQLLLAHRPLLALGYLTATVLGCAGAVWLAVAVTTAAGRLVRPGAAGPQPGPVAGSAVEAPAVDQVDFR